MTKKIRFPKWKVSTQMSIAVMAVIVSVCALATTMYQTYILQQQQHAAVWPRLSLLHGWQLEGNTPYYRLNLENTGVGPAIIEEMTIRHKNKSFRDFASLARYVAQLHQLPDSGAYQNYQDILPEMAIPQQEIEEVLFLANASYIKALTDELPHVQVEIIYKSLYDRRWKVSYPKVAHITLD
ncbi:MAG: hypothetical protein ACFB0B_06615 [Thermonemataceae bacterium]